MKKIYLAGPDVFRQDAVEWGKILRETCAVFGFEGLYPLDNEVNTYQETLDGIAIQVFAGNLKMIQQCDVVLANMTRFRGPSLDVGTAFEMGYAKALGKIVVGYTTDFRCYEEAAEEYAKKDGMRVEQFNFHDNLMTVLACDRVYSTLSEALYHLKHTIELKSQGEDNDPIPDSVQVRQEHETV